MKTVQLIPFTPQPISHRGGNYTIYVNITKSQQEITAEFVLQGDTNTIKWPTAAQQVRPGTDLWKHTCFELFLSEQNQRQYWEYNFSPARQWATYAFADYREPASLPTTRTPVIEPPQRSEMEFSQHVRFTPQAPLANKPLAIGVAAIIETTDGQRHFYALRHCGDKPDFHLRESFVLKMD
jgi:hypothetical protein